MEPVTAVILIVLGVLFVLPLGLALIILVISSIFKETNSNIAGLGRALTLPALVAMLFRFQLSQEKKEKANEHPTTDDADGGEPGSERGNVTPMRRLRD